MEYQNIQQQCTNDMLRELQEKHIDRQQKNASDKKGKEKENDRKNKKSRKDKNEKPIHEDRILIKSNIEPIYIADQQPAQRFNIPPKHDYQNIPEDEKKKIAARGQNEAENLRRFGDTNYLKVDRSKKPKNFMEAEMKCEIQDGLYILNSNQSNSSMTSFAELERRSKEKSKYISIDIKSPLNRIRQNLSNSGSSKTSSLSNKSQFDSIERTIILNGLQNASDHKISNSSYLGPFNFRQLLKPIQGPTESLRKRKTPPSQSSPPPSQRGKNV